MIWNVHVWSRTPREEWLRACGVCANRGPRAPVMPKDNTHTCLHYYTIMTWYFGKAIQTPRYCIYSENWELGTLKGLPETALNSQVVLFLRSISM